MLIAAPRLRRSGIQRDQRHQLRQHLSGQYRGTRKSFGSPIRRPRPDASCPLFDSSIPTIPKRCAVSTGAARHLIPARREQSVFASGRFAVSTRPHRPSSKLPTTAAVRDVVIQPVPHLGSVQRCRPTNPLFNVAPYKDGAGRRTTIVLTTTSPYYPTDVRPRHHRRSRRPTCWCATRGRRPAIATSPTSAEAPAPSPASRAGLGWDVDAALLYSRKQGPGARQQRLAYRRRKYCHCSTAEPSTSSVPTRRPSRCAFAGDQLQRRRIHHQDVASRAWAARRRARCSRCPPARSPSRRARRHARKSTTSRRARQIAAGDIEGYGGNPCRGRSTRDVERRLRRDQHPIVKGLEADVAVRYDHYERVGDSTTPKASLRWQPNQEICSGVRSVKAFGHRACRTCMRRSRAVSRGTVRPICCVAHSPMTASRTATPNSACSVAATSRSSPRNRIT